MKFLRKTVFKLSSAVLPLLLATAILSPLLVKADPPNPSTDGNRNQAFVVTNCTMTVVNGIYYWQLNANNGGNVYSQWTNSVSGKQGRLLQLINGSHQLIFFTGSPGQYEASSSGISQTNYASFNALYGAPSSPSMSATLNPVVTNQIVPYVPGLGLTIDALPVATNVSPADTLIISQHDTSTNNFPTNFVTRKIPVYMVAGTPIEIQDNIYGNQGVTTNVNSAAVDPNIGSANGNFQVTDGTGSGLAIWGYSSGGIGGKFSDGSGNSVKLAAERYGAINVNDDGFIVYAGMSDGYAFQQMPTPTGGMIYAGNIGDTTILSQGNGVEAYNSSGISFALDADTGDIHSSGTIYQQGSPVLVDISGQSLASANNDAGFITYVNSAATDPNISSDGGGGLIVSSVGNSSDLNLLSGGNICLGSEGPAALVGIGIASPNYELDIYDKNGGGVDIGNSSTGLWKIDNGGNVTAASFNFTDNSAGANWLTTVPTTVDDAINRIAAVVGGTVPIP